MGVFRQQVRHRRDPGRQRWRRRELRATFQGLRGLTHSRPERLRQVSRVPNMQRMRPESPGR